MLNAPAEAPFFENDHASVVATVLIEADIVGVSPEDLSRSGSVGDNAAMESFFSSLKTDRIAREMYRTRDEDKADVFDYIERFYNPNRLLSTIRYMSPMDFERQTGLV